MAAKGTTAKENVTKIIAKAFGNDFIGEYDKKLYVWADDGPGSRAQVSITLIHPKIYRGIEDTDATTLNFDDDDEVIKGTVGFKPADITQEEQDTLTELMKKLGL